SDGRRENHDGQLEQDGRKGICVAALAARGLGGAGSEQGDDRAGKPDPRAEAGHAPPGTFGPTSLPPAVRCRNSLGTGRPAPANPCSRSMPWITVSGVPTSVVPALTPSRSGSSDLPGGRPSVSSKYVTVSWRSRTCTC